ncbi:MAG: hypothetical protein Q8M94_01250, partial [Ignavibacteria bacterium]|nr:hypothetical protein [Ignavibacteria bacterium]
MTLTARMDGKAMQILRSIKARLIAEGNDKATLYDAVNWMDAHIKSLEKELAKTHSPASNIMNICTEAIKQANELISK